MAEMLCSSCGKQRAELHAKRSRLITNMPLYLCNDCIKSKFEPRFIIILQGRKNGPESVAEYIVNKRYCGKEILASELISHS